MLDMLTETIRDVNDQAIPSYFKQTTGSVAEAKREGEYETIERNRDDTMISRRFYSSSALSMSCSSLPCTFFHFPRLFSRRSCSILTIPLLPLVVGVVLVGNCKFEMRVVLGASYILIELHLDFLSPQLDSLVLHRRLISLYRTYLSKKPSIGHCLFISISFHLLHHTFD